MGGIGVVYMYNEVMVRKYTKKVLGYGIPKLMAQEIVELAMETSRGKEIEKYINYAIDLVYGMGFSKKFATK